MQQLGLIRDGGFHGNAGRCGCAVVLLLVLLVLILLYIPVRSPKGRCRCIREA